MKKYFEEKMATYDDYFFTARLNTLDKVCWKKGLILWQISEF